MSRLAAKIIGAIAMVSMAACSIDPAATDIRVGDVVVPGVTLDASIDSGQPPLRDGGVDIDAPVNVPDPLYSLDLVARYMVNEASSGTGTGTIYDFAPDPLPLDLYEGTGAEYTGALGDRAINFPDVYSNHRLQVATQNTKIQNQLDQSVEFSIEMVVNVRERRSESHLMQIAKINRGGVLCLRWDDDDRLSLFWHNNKKLADWELDVVGEGKMVLTVVVDMTEFVEENRIRLFKNGILVTNNSTETPGRFSTLSFSGHSDAHLLFGNRQSGDRGIRGRLHYAAIYGAALGQQTASENARRLLADNDNP